MKKLTMLLVCLAFSPGLFAQACKTLSPSAALCPVDSAGSTTAGNYVKWNSTKTAVTNGSTTDTAGLVVGISRDAASGSSGNPAWVFVYLPGSFVPAANFDNVSAQGDNWCISTSTGGQLHDCGALGNDQVLGVVNSTVNPAGSNQVYIQGHLPNAIPTLTTVASAPGQWQSTCPVTDPGGSNYFIINDSGGACTYTLPVPSLGQQRCVWNYAGQSGVFTVKANTAGVIAYQGVNGSASTTTGIVSGGALGDEMCFVADNTNHWNATLVRGTWTNN